MLEHSMRDRHIWDAQGELRPLDSSASIDREVDVAVIIVSRNRPDLVDSMVEQLQTMGRHLSKDLFVIEMGTDQDKQSQYCSLNYPDPDFRGKCYGHNVGLRLARTKGTYRYYWILMNDLVFEQGVDALQELVNVADANPEIAVLSPTEPESPYPACKPSSGQDFHLVSTCDYLALLVRAETVDQVDFLNPDFRYCWGAIHELAFKLYSNGWRVAYCDRVTMKHLGGTTYGKAKGTISREEYQQKAKEFAARYFVEHYGKKWDKEFSKVLPPGIGHNTFKLHRSLWESALEDEVSESHRSKKGIVATIKSIPKKFRRTFSRGSSDSSLIEKIESLHPWYYELKVGNITVTPGVGAKQTADELRGRVKYRAKLLIDEVLKYYDFSGKRLLDIASNCGYWPARYAECGATSLVAVEGRLDYVKQGLLYWSTNNFMPADSYEFIHGNVMSSATWENLRKRGPFDFTLCCGILYHIPDYKALLSNIAMVTTDTILIDTRVSDNEKFVEEPGGWHFDSIIETRIKKVPTLDRLLEALSDLGFSTNLLAIDEQIPEGLRGNDDYSQKKRVVLLGAKSKDKGDKDT